MKTLFIMRHAKSSWDDANLADFDRPLNQRGQHAAPLMGIVMGDLGFKPDVIISSPAVRARQTAELVKEAGRLGSVLHFEPQIYEASPNTLRQVVSKIADANSSAMIVGHNPGMEGFIRYLTGEIKAMPTAALAVIELDINKWSEINDGSGQLMTVIRPKDMMT